MTLWPTLITGLIGVAGIAETILAARAKGSTLPGDERSPTGIQHMVIPGHPTPLTAALNRINRGIQDTRLLYSVSYHNVVREHLAKSFGIG
jgi:hypothetical protein